MIRTLTGGNGFALQAQLVGLLMAFVAEHGDLALERVDGEEVELAKINEALNSLPFLAAKKLVVLRAPSTNKQFAEQAEQILSDLSETTEVIIVEPKLDKRTAYYKFLKSKTEFQEFNELDQNGLAQWLVAAAKEKGGLLSNADARYLVERTGMNQQMLSSDLEKLLLYDANISRQTIDLLTDPAPQSTIFQLLEAAFAGNTKTVLKLYAEQRAQKVEPPQIVAMLAWQLHILAIIKTAGDKQTDQISREAKLNPFVVRKSQGITRNLSLTELKNLIADLLRIDIDTKRTNTDPDEALQHYLLKIAK